MDWIMRAFDKQAHPHNNGPMNTEQEQAQHESRELIAIFDSMPAPQQATVSVMMTRIGAMTKFMPPRLVALTLAMLLSKHRMNSIKDQGDANVAPQSLPPV